MDTQIKNDQVREAGSLVRLTITEQVVEDLRAKILGARLNPGEKFRFNELRQEFKVSTGTLREALLRLAADHLVEIHAQKGFRVASVSLKELIDIIELQKMLELAALRRAIAVGDDDWEAQIVAAHHRMICLEQRENDGKLGKSSYKWEQSHHKFHQALIFGCDSPWLLKFCRLLREQAMRYRHFANVPPSPYPTLTVQHKPIMEATLNRDVEKACRLLDNHFEETAKIVLKAMKKMGVV